MPGGADVEGGLKPGTSGLTTGPDDMKGLVTGAWVGGAANGVAAGLPG